MANKDFTKDVVPRSIVSYRKCQYSSDSGNIRKWPKHRHEKRKLKFKFHKWKTKKGNDDRILLSKVVGKWKTKIKVWIPFPK